MKNSKKLKLILEILICVLLILIGVVGVYTKSSNMYKNKLPHTYTLASDINGATVIVLTPDDSIETIYYDKDGNEVDSSKVTDKNKKDYTTKEIPVNDKENLNFDNYKACLEIMKERLELLDADQYQINLDEKTGTILLTVEDDYMQDIESFLPREAKMQFMDSVSEKVIIDSSDFKSAEASYSSLTLETRTYINLKLKDSAIEKIKNIDSYKSIKNVEGKEPEESKVLVVFDGETLSEVSYNDLLLNGKTLRITTGSGLTSETDINSQMNINTIASKLATIGKMPVIYTITTEEFVKNDLNNMCNYGVIALIAICIVVSIILVVKYKTKGLLGVLGFVTNISIFLIVIRLTNIKISLNGFAGMVGLIVLNMILIKNILKCTSNKEKVFSENIRDAYLKSLDAIVIMLIILIVFAFSAMTVINEVGLLLFWGWIVAVIGNLIFTVPMLSIIANR